MIGRELEKRYRVLEKLGEGAMGEVYLVEHLGLRRKEAMKVLHAALGDSPDIVARFRREARASNRLQHPNIVCVYDFGRLPDGRFYLTSEYAEGEPLDLVLRKAGRFPIARALHVLAQLADAVDHAHARGVIHRDLKPANIIVVERRGHADVLKVLDFGIAKIIAPDYSETVAATAEGQVFGTPAYMAPEQVGGQGRDPRIDLYAFGCIGHELVTGDPPFTGKTIEVMNAHLAKAPPRPSERRRDAGIPSELDAIILRCLEKDPDRRFQTAREILAALRQVPGFPDDRHSSGKRLRLEAPTREDAGPINDFTVSPDTGVKGPHAIGVAETLFGSVDQEAPADEPIDPETARLGVEAVMLRLAEALIDGGCNDPRMSMTAAQIAGVRADLDGIEARMEELERAGAETEQRGREREARLSFAIGELRFDIEEARVTRAPVAPDIAFQVGQLEQRLAELHAEIEREQHGITDRAIGLAAEKATREDELAALHGTLARLVDEHAPRFAGVASIRDLGQRLQRARATLKRAETGG